MSKKLQLYQGVAEQESRNITDNSGNWRNFLDTAARMYKYPFPDQLLIYAQRPDAIACATMDTWNDSFNRWVVSGSKGIALIDDTGNFPRIKYVFDVNDTQPSLYNSRPVKLWEMQQSHRELVLEALDGIYDDVSDNIADSFRNIAQQLANEYYDDNAHEIRLGAEGSRLNNFDDHAVSEMFKQTLTNSIAYSLMSRCGFDTAEHFDDDDFLYLSTFNTPDTAYALGTATNELSAQVLRDIERVIKKHERLQTAERSVEDERENNIQPGGGLFSHRHTSERAAEGTDRTVGNVRTNEENISERTSQDNIQHNAIERNAVPASARSGGSGELADGASDENSNRGDETTRQSNESNGVDGRNERPESPSERDGFDRTDLRQLNTETLSAQDGVFHVNDGLSQVGTRLTATNTQLSNSVSAILQELGYTISYELFADAVASYDRNGVTVNALDLADFIKEQYLSSDYGSEIFAKWGGKHYLQIVPPSEVRKIVNILVYNGDEEKYNAFIADGVSDAEIATYITNQFTNGDFGITLGNGKEASVGIRDDGIAFTVDGIESFYNWEGIAAFVRELYTLESAKPLNISDIPTNESITQPENELSKLPPISETLSTSSITLGEVDSILRDGGNDSKSILRIAAFFAKNLSSEENAEFLRNEYLGGRWGWRNNTPGGKGYQFGSKPTAVWFDDNGVAIGRGKSALFATDFAVITWEQVALRVKELYDTGMFVSHDVLDEALYNESLELADDFIELYKNISRGLGDVKWDIRRAMKKDQQEALKDDWRIRRYLIQGLDDYSEKVEAALNGGTQLSAEELMNLYSEADDLSVEIPQSWNFNGSHPDTVESVTELLRDKNERTSMIERLRSDIEEISAEPNTQIRFYRNPKRVLNMLERAGLPMHNFPVADYQPLNYMRFITDDEVDNYLARGGSYSEGKLRILSHFLNEHTPKERQDFLKNEYGNGGGTWIGGGNQNYEPSKGILLQRPGCDDVKLSWPTATKKTNDLIKHGRYVSQSDLDMIPSYEKIILARQINNYFYDLPDEYQRPFSKELDFYYPKDAEWEAINDLLLNDEKLGAVLSEMWSIFENRLFEDRHFNFRKTTLDHLTAYREGTFTLFPHVERLPAPSFNQQRRTSRVTEQIFSDDSTVAGAPMQAEQLDLFNFGEPPPNLPPPEEQKAKIEQAHKTAEATASAVSLPITQDEIDALLLSVSDSNKERLAVQISNNPRSKEAVNLIRRIYGNIEKSLPRMDGKEGFIYIFGEDNTIAIFRDAPLIDPAFPKQSNGAREIEASLNLPVPTIIKRLSELEADGRLDVKAQEQAAAQFVEESTSAQEQEQPTTPIETFAPYAEFQKLKAEYPDHLVFYQMGDFFEFYQEDAEIVCKELDIPIATRNIGLPESLIFGGIPSDKLGDYIERLCDAGHSLVYSATTPSGNRSIVPITQEDAETAEISTPEELNFDDVAKIVCERVMQDTEFSDALENAKSRGALRIPLNNALDKVIHQLKQTEQHIHTLVTSDDDFNDKLFEHIYLQSWESKLATEAMAQEKPLAELIRRELDARGFAVSDEIIADGITEYTESGGTGGFDVIADFIQEEFLTEDIPAPLASPPPIFFVDWESAQHDLDLNKYSDGDVIGYNKDGVEYKIGRTGNLTYTTQTTGITPWGDITGATNIPREIWEQMNAYRNGELSDEQVRDNYTEILRIYNEGSHNVSDHEAPSAPQSSEEKPRISYIKGSRVVLDLREKLKDTLQSNMPFIADEFIIDDFTDDNVTVTAHYRNVVGGMSQYSVELTHDEIEQFTVKPVATKLHEDLNYSDSEVTAYYLFHYPDGINAGAGVSRETLALIPEKANNYVLCAEMCFIDAEEMKAASIEFRKLPRDYNLLPFSAKEKLFTLHPEYEQQWLESYGEQQPNPFVQEIITQESPPSTPQSTKPSLRFASQNFRITDDNLGEGGAKKKFWNNIEAIHILKALEQEGRNANPEEQEFLSKYVGWGGISQAFDENNDKWGKEYFELKNALTSEEYESARASTLNAHYTSPTVIRAMYETIERMGFKTGNVLEPSCGVGNFFGLLPDSMRQSKLYGVELDSVTARIAKHLYPSANILETGFEKTEIPDAFFDLAIGNVPFGSYGVTDKRYDKHKFMIHDYFFARTLDQVRPGGIIAFVTSKGTLDKANPEVRKYIAQRADLLGAVRLPNTAFLRNAGTEVTSDIIFLQKRDRPADIVPEWVHLGQTDDEIPINRYFLENPKMVLGTMVFDDSLYGNKRETACIPIEGADLGEQLKSALSNIQGQITEIEVDDIEGIENHAIPADPNVKNFSYTVVNGEVYFRENSQMFPVDLPATTTERIKGMIALRDCTNELVNLQLEEYGESEIKAKQAELSKLYDNFTAEYGLINSQANSRAFNADNSYYLLSSLEVIDENGKLERKADMFTKRTIKQRTVITHVDTASEALAVSLGEKACVDLDYMRSLTGFSREKLIDDLKGVIFLNLGSADDPRKMYVTADEYLSGNVRHKLELARASQATIRDGSIDVNVSALEAALPKDLDASEIAVRMGATWINPAYYQQFMYELLQTPYRSQNVYQINFHNLTGEWQVTGKNRAQYSDIHATVTYGTERANAFQIIDDTLNLRDVRIYDYEYDADGKKKRILNKKETTLAQQKQEIIKQAFKDWIWQDPERRQTLAKLYNESFNNTKPREYDGSHLNFVGINPEEKLRNHQVNAIARIMYGGNTLLAHVVGAGKTWEIVAAAMESKRLGLCNKSLITVPNHLTEQWAGQFLRLYPSANILVATKKDFEMRNRKKFCAKIATGDYDAVIIGHSQLEKIPISQERQVAHINEQLWEIEVGLRELKDNDAERFSIKQLEKTKKNLELRLSRLLDAKKRDDVVTFEQLGVDRLFVDEAHYYKNLFLYTKMRNVAGLSTSEAQKSSDLFMKCRYLDEITGNKGVIFATGTPISNSITEMYTLQRYLQYDTLAAKSLVHFDSWASIFGETQTSIELAPEGTGYRARTRFAKFHNLPELMAMYKEVADIQTADMLNLPVPLAKFETIIVEPSEIQKEMVQDLSERASRIHNGGVDPRVDNMLKITTDGRKIGLDQRLINPLLPDFEGSKANICAENIFKIWEDTKPEKLTQLAFCDFSTPNSDGRFNLYDDIKVKLLKKGIPEHEIAFIHDADTETRKKELFAKVRLGKVRVLLGSTFKMGAGTNVQDLLVATHDIDCPWRPSDLEQRSGRIIRQGNNNDEVMIYRYATQGTFDSYLWQTVEAKQKFISQVQSSKSPVRSCEDVDETALSYAEIKALCAGNPLIAEKMNLDVEVAKLRMLKAEHNSQRYRLEDDLLKHYPEQITATNGRIAGIEKDIGAYAKQHAKTLDIQTGEGGSASFSANFPGMTINGVEYKEKEPAAKALLESTMTVTSVSDAPIGEYMGFKMSLSMDSWSKKFSVNLRGAMTYKVELGTDAFGNITRINNALNDLPKRLEGVKSQLETLLSQQEAAKEQIKKPFLEEAELAEKEARLALLNADLNIDGNGGMDVINDTDARTDDEFDIDSDEDCAGGQEVRIAAKATRPPLIESLRSYSSARQPEKPSSMPDKQSQALGKKQAGHDI